MPCVYYGTMYINKQMGHNINKQIDMHLNTKMEKNKEKIKNN